MRSERPLHSTVKSEQGSQAARGVRSSNADVLPQTDGVAVWVAVHRRAATSWEDRSRTLVRAEPIRTTATRAANAVGLAVLAPMSPHGHRAKAALGPITDNCCLAHIQFHERQLCLPAVSPVRTPPRSAALTHGTSRQPSASRAPARKADRQGTGAET